MKVLAVIPARWRSSRFPGKPLAKILGKTMIQRVYEQVQKTEEVTDILLATDDEKIFNYCKENNLNVIMTSSDHATGTDRVAEVAEKIDADIYVNVQGDEPVIPPEAIDRVVRRLRQVLDKGIEVVNAYDNNLSEKDKEDYSIVKLVPTIDGNVLFLSRYAIPYEKNQKYNKKTHLGLYSLTKNSLRKFSNWGRGFVEKSESIEMMRFLEHDEKIACVEVPGGSISVDFPEDIIKVEDYLRENNLN